MHLKLSVSSLLFRLLQTHIFIQFFNSVLNLPNRLRRYVLFAVDSIIFWLAACIALALRFDDSPQSLLDFIHFYGQILQLIVPVKFFMFYLLGMYRPLVRHTGVETLWLALKSVVLSEFAVSAIASLLGIRLLPRSVQIISALVVWIGVVAARFTMRQLIIVADSQSKKRPGRRRLLNSIDPSRKPTSRLDPIIIYGAGAAGFQLSQALLRDPVYKVVAFIDDNPDLYGRWLDGIKIYASEMLPSLIHQSRVTTVLLAIPSATPQQKRQVLEKLRGLPVQVKTVPTIGEILTGKVSIGQLRNVDISDLLGREEVLPDPSLLRMNITDKVVLVTGAGGSIGSELCRQIAQQQPKLLVMYDLNEFALYAIDTELAEAYPHVHRTSHLGSVTDAERLTEILKQYQVETVYHAAAYKHVPLVEKNPAQGILNNTYGTLVTAQTAEKCGVQTFVLISTDKAVRPTNVMGATKRAAELVLQALAAQTTQTRFVMVRFGNVLNSSGSVVPRFRQQIAQGKSLTVTHPEMTRYFMSIPEASRLVIQAGAIGQGGEVFLLDMGEPVRIYDLAVQMIELSGLVPGEDISIEITGLRPGEKLYEELLIDGNAIATCHPKIFAAREGMISWERLEPMLDQLFLAAYQNQIETMRSRLKLLVPEYQPQSNSSASMLSSSNSK